MKKILLGIFLLGIIGCGDNQKEESTMKSTTNKVLAKKDFFITKNDFDQNKFFNYLNLNLGFSNLNLSEQRGYKGIEKTFLDETAIEYVVITPKKFDVQKTFKYEFNRIKNMGYEIIETGDNYYLLQDESPIDIWQILLYRDKDVIIKLSGMPTERLENYKNLFL